MSDNVKDVNESNEQKSVTALDNARLEETLRGYRVLYFNQDHFLARLFKIDSIRIYDKSILSISSYGDRMFTKTKNILMKNMDILTYQEQMEILESRGLWNDEREKELDELKNRARELSEDKDKKMSKVQSSRSKKKQKEESEEAEKMVELYREIFEKFTELAGINYFYFKDTIEMQCEQAQRKGWIVSAVCRNVDDDGKDLPCRHDTENQVWADTQSLESDMKDKDLTSLISECINYWDFQSGGGDSFFAESPDELTSGSDGEPQNDSTSNSSREQETPLN